MAYDMDMNHVRANDWIRKVEQEFQASKTTLDEVTKICAEETNGDTILEQMVIVSNNCLTAWNKLKTKYDETIRELKNIFSNTGKSVDDLVQAAKRVGSKNNY